MFMMQWYNLKILIKYFQAGKIEQSKWKQDGESRFTFQQGSFFNSISRQILKPTQTTILWIQNSFLGDKVD